MQKKSKPMLQLDRICRRMTKQGFHYAAFVDTFMYSKQPQYEVGLKPQPATMFTRIVENNGWMVPEQITLNRNPDSTRHLVVAQFKPETIMSQTELEPHARDSAIASVTHFDWTAAARFHAGVHIDDPRDVALFGLDQDWHVETVAVWDVRSAVQKMQVFFNKPGTEWEYTELKRT